MNEHVEKFETEILLGSPCPLEVLELAIDELHAYREAVGVSANSVEVQIEACVNYGKQAVRVRMKEAE